MLLLSFILLILISSGVISKNVYDNLLNKLLTYRYAKLKSGEISATDAF